MPWRMAPLFAIGTMLMHSHRGGVDHLQVPIVCLRYSFEDAVPHADLCPTPKPIGTSRRRPVSLGDVCPGRTQTIPFSTLRSSARGTPLWLVRQQWLNDRPFEIIQFVAAWVHQGTSTHLESPLAASHKVLLWVHDRARAHVDPGASGSISQQRQSGRGKRRTTP